MSDEDLNLISTKISQIKKLKSNCFSILKEQENSIKELEILFQDSHESFLKFSDDLDSLFNNF